MRRERVAAMCLGAAILAAFVAAVVMVLAAAWVTFT